MVPLIGYFCPLTPQAGNVGYKNQAIANPSPAVLVTDTSCRAPPFPFYNTIWMRQSMFQPTMGAS